MTTAPQRGFDHSVLSGEPRVIARDTEAGDVIVDPQGRAYRVENGHFREVGAIEALTKLHFFTQRHGAGCGSR
jgi:hypothetical protein